MKYGISKKIIDTWSAKTEPTTVFITGRDQRKIEDRLANSLLFPLISLKACSYSIYI